MAISPKVLKRLRDTFLDETVVIYLQGMNVIAPTPEGSEMSITAMIEVYVVDIDLEYLYLGLPDGTVTKVIRHDIAPMIEISYPANELMIGEYPESDEEVH